MSEKKYKIVNGTSYSENTPEEVIKWLETSRERKQRIRIFYGDKTTGIDWKEESDIQGYVGRSTGNIKIPILINNSRSFGGGAILDDCILKITTKGSDGKIQIVYQNIKYKLYKESNSISYTADKDFPYSVYYDGIERAAFKTKEKAENYIKFLQGKRNKI